MDNDEEDWKAAVEVRRWAGRTTMEGLPNITASTSVLNRIIWGVILLTVLAIGFTHLAFSIKNFVNSGVYSEMMIDATAARFPDVTICNLKPISESLIGYYKKELTAYLQDEWNMFDEWFVPDRRQLPGESAVDYMDRVGKLFHRMLVVMGLSDEMGYLGLDGSHSIMDCTFNGVQCSHRNFSAVHHPEYMNCYTFSPHEEFGSRNYAEDYENGLTISVFTDNNILQSSYNLSTVYESQHLSKDFSQRGMSLKEYLFDIEGALSINDLIAGDLQADGMMVILHPNNTYPFNHHSHESYILQNGMAGTYRIETVESIKINRPTNPCNEKSLGSIEYVTSFGLEPEVEKTREFIKTANDVANMRYQEEVYEECGCYSHLFPFQSKTELCLFAPPHERMTPSRELIDRILCHDRWAPSAMRGLSHGKHMDISELPCKLAYREVQADTTEWPNEEDLALATMNFFQKWLSDDSEGGSGGIGTGQELFMDRVKKYLTPGQLPLSRGRLGIISVLQVNCSVNQTSLQELMRNYVNTCFDTERIQRNFLRINVRLASGATVSYNEKYAYGGWEILSEIGGILGLWFGISIMTICELIELIALVVEARRAPPARNLEPGKEQTPMRREELEELEELEDLQMLERLELLEPMQLLGLQDAAGNQGAQRRQQPTEQLKISVILEQPKTSIVKFEQPKKSSVMLVQAKKSSINLAPPKKSVDPLERPAQLLEKLEQLKQQEEMLNQPKTSVEKLEQPKTPEMQEQLRYR